jgi:cardiolipin synthase
MSANLEEQGLDRGFEVGALLPRDEAVLVAETLRSWAASFPWEYQASATRADHLGDFCLARASLRKGVQQVIELHTQSLPATIGSDALNLGSAPAPALKALPPQQHLPRRVKFSWEVRPPHLPKGAKERMQKVEREQAGQGDKPKRVISHEPYDPAVFDHDGQVFVILRSADQTDRVRRAAAGLGARVVLP